MTVLTLDVNIVMRITGDPYLYNQAPFLDRLQIPASNLHHKYNRCTACQRISMIKSFTVVANAMTKLIQDESVRPNNQLPALRAAINKILRTEATEIVLQYKKDGLQAEIRF